MSGGIPKRFAIGQSPYRRRRLIEVTTPDSWHLPEIEHDPIRDDLVATGEPICRMLAISAWYQEQASGTEPLPEVTTAASCHSA